MTQAAVSSTDTDSIGVCRRNHKRSSIVPRPRPSPGVAVTCPASYLPHSERRPPTRTCSRLLLAGAEFITDAIGLRGVEP